MEIFLVTASDYDYALIDSAWTTREEAEARIAEAQSTPEAAKLADYDYTAMHSQNFRVKAVKLGEILDDVARFKL